MVREGLGQAGVGVLLGGHRQKTRGLVHEHQVLVLQEDREGAARGLAGLGQRVVDHVRVEDHVDDIVGLEAVAVAAHLHPADLDAAGVDEALGLPVADLQLAVQFGGEGATFDRAGPVFLRSGHGLLQCLASVETLGLLEEDHEILYFSSEIAWTTWLQRPSGNPRPSPG